MIIKGSVVFKKCPKTGKEGRLYQDCMKADDPKNKCEHFKHFGVEGHSIVIACGYDEFERYKKDMKKEAKNVE